ncbi:MAG: hypothetical protein UZ22_OP11002000811 [Microgenomates bacterium OLB23]|nr:MAG: hypothetical protein UZ22_OP11002000811 [Microgenomates bacterium OLB23]
MSLRFSVFSAVFSFIVFLALASFAAAQNVPAPLTATPSPIVRGATATPGVGLPLPTDTPHKSIANCDMCGYCQGVAKVPGSWQACARCLYPGVAKAGTDTDPTTLATLTNADGLIPTPDPNHFYTGFGCLSTQPGEFTTQMSSLFFR